jgi:DNA-binding MarR family transcriptional regulator
MSGSNGLTPKQGQALRAIVAYVDGHGYGPTLDELAEALGTVKANAWRYVDVLEKAGRVVRDRNARGLAMARTLRVVGPHRRSPQPGPGPHPRPLSRLPKTGGYGRGE